MTAYYSENDPKAAAWLRELIRAGHIADGVVDERSIVDVPADDLRGFTQWHLFAGIGVWSYALRQAGWPDSRPVFTGSCPCQPFSAAGKQLGTDDHRHLWPEMRRLIAELRPPEVIGEQVASAAGRSWLNTVRLDLEAMGYGVGAADLCSASCGSPHIRQRLYFVGERGGDPIDAGLERLPENGDGARGWPQPAGSVAAAGDVVRLADAECLRLGGGRFGNEHHAESGGGEEAERGVDRFSTPAHDTFGWLADAKIGGRREFRDATQPGSGGHADGGGNIGGMADTDGRDASAEREQCGGEQRLQPGGCESGRVADTEHNGWWSDEQERGSQGGATDGGNSARICGDERPGPTNGFWLDPDWLFCRDGKWRPVIPSSVAMADGPPPGMVRSGDGRLDLFHPLSKGEEARTMRLRGYGNAITAQVAIAFISSYMELSK